MTRPDFNSGPHSHYNWHTGKPCRCSWGRPDLLKHGVSASALDQALINHDLRVAATWDEMKGWKKLQSPEAQGLMQHLERGSYVAPFTEKWMPWLLNQVRQQNVAFDPETYPHGNPHALQYQVQGAAPWPLPATRWHHMADWFNSGHPTRQAIDPNKASIQDVHEGVSAWDADMEARQKEMDANARANDGKVVHQLDNGWTIRQLQKADEAKREGEAMGHCVGGYGSQIENGETLVYSLRDPKGHPHVTFGIDPLNFEDEQGRPVDGDSPAGLDLYPRPHGGTAYNIEGTGNTEPKPEYKDMIKNWMETFPPEDRPEGESDEYGYGDGAMTWRDLEGLGKPDGSGFDAYGMKAPEDSLRYKDILDSMVEDSVGNYNEQYRGDPNLLYGHALARKEIPKLGDAIEELRDEQQQSFDDWRDQNYEHQMHPYPQDDDFDNTPEGQAAYDEAEKAHYEEENEWASQHAGMNLSNDMYGLMNKHWDPKAGEYGGWSNEVEPERVGRTAASKPIYYRWVFTPSGVELSHNDDEHPANLQYHQDLGSEVNEQNMVHGYAYRIHNGWRLTDWEHKPIEDPYVQKSVVDAINNEEGIRAAAVEPQPAWEPDQLDYDRLHYGRPLPLLLED